MESSIRIIPSVDKPGESVASMFDDMAKAHAEFSEPVKNQVAEVRPATGQPYSFKYADLESVIAAISPAWGRYGINAIQSMTQDQPLPLQVPSIGRDGKEYTRTVWTVACHMTTLVTHKSGAMIESLVTWTPVIDNAKIQALGGCETYLRRYVLKGVAGVSDTDLDAAEVSGDEIKLSSQPAKPKAEPKKEPPKEEAKPEPAVNTPEAQAEEPSSKPSKETLALMRECYISLGWDRNEIRDNCTRHLGRETRATVDGKSISTLTETEAQELIAWMKAGAPGATKAADK